MDVLLKGKRCLGVVKLMMGLHHMNLKVMEFIMELDHENSKDSEASVGASP